MGIAQMEAPGNGLLVSCSAFVGPFPFLGPTLRWDNLGIPQRCNLPSKKLSRSCIAKQLIFPNKNAYFRPFVFAKGLI